MHYCLFSCFYHLSNRCLIMKLLDYIIIIFVFLFFYLAIKNYKNGCHNDCLKCRKECFSRTKDFLEKKD